MTVASLILARSVAEMMTASCLLLDSVFYLMVLSSSREMTLAPVFWAVFFLPPKRDSSTNEFYLLERWLVLDPNWD